jgi:tRNA uridine 5-carboxymethylaminomethyl modification enzyme
LHQSIRSNIHESPLYSGQIQGVGPRYCPSIEDKVVKFPDKTRHQLFLEPEGHETYEIYLNGFSTSLPAELQQELVHQVTGLEQAKVIRPGYAIEYDFVDPRELTPFLQTTRVKGLFFAGQINGTTGYEEAACQGFIAGVNAALFVQGREGFRLRRDESYIGVLIDDLINYGVDEPYRMFTSRAEYRLALRHDTADARLSPYGHDLGLLGDSEWDRFNQRRDRLARLRSALETTRFRRRDAGYEEFARLLGKDLGDSVSLAQLAQYPKVGVEFISQHLPADIRSDANLPDLETALADLLYHGYLNAQRNTFERIFHYDELRVPSGFNYRQISGLSHEMVERLERAQPQNFGQARRIPGMTPAALSLLLFRLRVPKAA